MASRGNQNNLSPDWTPAEDAILAAYADPAIKVEEIQRGIPTRTIRAILCRASMRGITAKRKWAKVEAMRARARSDFAFNFSLDELTEFAGHRR